jgi:hypothetical protein
MAKQHSSQPSPDSTKSANKERVRFIFEPDRHSPNGVTFTWLIHKTYNGKEKAAIATRSFWLPFAYRDSGISSDAELRELAQQSIWKLEEQIQYLRESFGLEGTPRPIAPATPSQVVQTEAIASTKPIAEPPESQPVLEVEGLNLKANQELLDEFSEVL